MTSAREQCKLVHPHASSWQRSILTTIIKVHGNERGDGCVQQRQATENADKRLRIRHHSAGAVQASAAASAGASVIPYG